MKQLTVIKTLVLINIQKNMEYRSSFLISSISSIIWFIIPMIIFNYIFLNVDKINGWSFNDVIILVGTYTLIDSFMMGFLINSMRNIETDIISGELDRKLSYPIDTQLFYFFSDINLGQMLNSVFGIFIIIYGLINGNYTLDFFRIILFLLFLVLGMITYYCIWFIWTVTVFWWPSSKSRNDLFLNMIVLARYPNTIYLNVGKILFHYLIPVVFIANPATQILINKATNTFLITSLVITFILLILSRILWLHGLKSYESVGK